MFNSFLILNIRTRGSDFSLATACFKDSLLFISLVIRVVSAAMLEAVGSKLAKLSFNCAISSSALASSQS